MHFQPSVIDLVLKFDDTCGPSTLLTTVLRVANGAFAQGSGWSTGYKREIYCPAKANEKLFFVASDSFAPKPPGARTGALDTPALLHD
jgi:hypothetical protein